LRDREEANPIRLRWRDLQGWR